MSIAKIIILAGQSNAVGVGHTKYLPRNFSSEKVDIAHYDSDFTIKLGYLFAEKI